MLVGLRRWSGKCTCRRHWRFSGAAAAKEWAALRALRYRRCSGQRRRINQMSGRRVRRYARRTAVLLVVHDILTENCSRVVMTSLGCAPTALTPALRFVLLQGSVQCCSGLGNMKKPQFRVRYIWPDHNCATNAMHRNVACAASADTTYATTSSI